MGSVQVGGANVAWGEQGPADGVPVVLVHGSTGSRASWVMVAPLLEAAGLRVVLPEYAGSGETTDDGGPLEVATLADQVAGVVEALGLGAGGRPWHLAGWSLGAVVGADLAARRPAGLASATLVCGWLRSDAWMKASFDLWVRLLEADPLLFMRYAFTQAVAPSFFDIVGEGLEAMVAVGASALAPGSARHAELDGRVDVSGIVGAIDVPTVVVTGAHDRIIPPMHAAQLAEAIPGARLVELLCGHTAVNEEPDALARIILEQVRAAT